VLCHNARVEMMIGVSGGEIWAEDSGGNGPPLVLLHPGWGDSSIWDPMLAALAQLPRQFRVIRYDTRGFGKSPAPVAAYTHLADLTAILDHLEVAHAVLVAHSGAGSPAMSLALAEPQRVRQLILVAPGVQDYPWPTGDSYFTEFGRLFEAGDRDGLVALGLQTWAAAGADPAAQAQVRVAVAAFFRQGEFERPDPPAYERLGEITAHSVLVIGDLDHPMIHDAAAAIANRIPGCSTVTVPDADHLLPLRAPRRLADLINSIVPQA
jgi:3-oxoadipate enol-lactonase